MFIERCLANPGAPFRSISEASWSTRLAAAQQPTRFLTFASSSPYIGMRFHLSFNRRLRTEQQGEALYEEDAKRN